MKKPNFSWKRVADSFSTRSFRAGGYSVAAAAIVLAIAVMVNVFAAALPASVTKFDPRPISCSHCLSRRRSW